MNIRQVRKKMKSVFNVKKITKAMQMVSAIKMKKSQELAYEGKPYRENLEKIIQKMLSTLEPSYSSLILKKAVVSKQLIIVISSNKGLCGSFNFNLFRHIVHTIDPHNIDFITIGKKGAIFISKMGGTIIADFSNGTFIDNVSAVLQSSLSMFLDTKYSEVLVVYNKFINTLTFKPTTVVLLPINIETLYVDSTKIIKPNSEYVIEPSASTMIDALLRSFVEERIRGAIIDSEAAEHSSRMVAMKNATENAEDVIYNLMLLRNKLRQEKITYELLDMITAKESVEAN